MKNLSVFCDIKISYSPKVKASERPFLTKSKASYDLLRQTWDDGDIQLYETFKVAMLDGANRVIGVFEASKGGFDTVVADVRMIFATALKARANAIILAHNHPSGLLRASKADLYITDKIVSAGKILDIRVLDHIILANEGYLSMSDEGGRTHIVYGLQSS